MLSAPDSQRFGAPTRPRRFRDDDQNEPYAPLAVVPAWGPRSVLGVAAASPTGGGDKVATFEVTMRDGMVEVIEGADAYQQEGLMTTFFTTSSGRQVVDCWSTRMASFRTSEVVIVRRVTRVLTARDERVAASPNVAAELPRSSPPATVAELRSA